MTANAEQCCDNFILKWKGHLIEPKSIIKRSIYIMLYLSNNLHKIMIAICILLDNSDVLVGVNHWGCKRKM